MRRSTRNHPKPRFDRQAERPWPPGGGARLSSIARKLVDLGEEHILPALRCRLDRAYLGHEERRLEDLLRRQREGVVGIADDRRDLVDTVFGILRHLQIDPRGFTLVLVDDVDRLAERREEGAVDRRV